GPGRLRAEAPGQALGEGPAQRPGGRDAAVRQDGVAAEQGGLLPPGGPGDRAADRRLQHGAHRPLRLLVRGALRDLPGEPLAVVPGEREERLLLGGEVVEEGARGDARLGADLLDRDHLRAVLGEQPDRRGAQRRAGHPLLAFAQALRAVLRHRPPPLSVAGGPLSALRSRPAWSHGFTPVHQKLHYCIFAVLHFQFYRGTIPCSAPSLPVPRESRGEPCPLRPRRPPTPPPPPCRPRRPWPTHCGSRRASPAASCSAACCRSAARTRGSSPRRSRARRPRPPSRCARCTTPPPSPATPPPATSSSWPARSAPPWSRPRWPPSPRSPRTTAPSWRSPTPRPPPPATGWACRCSTWC